MIILIELTLCHQLPLFYQRMHRVGSLTKVASHLFFRLSKRHVRVNNLHIIWEVFAAYSLKTYKLFHFSNLKFTLLRGSIGIYDKVDTLLRLFLDLIINLASRQLFVTITFENLLYRETHILSCQPLWWELLHSELFLWNYLSQVLVRIDCCIMNPSSFRKFILANHSLSGVFQNLKFGLQVILKLRGVLLSKLSLLKSQISLVAIRLR